MPAPLSTRNQLPQRTTSIEVLKRLCCERKYGRSLPLPWLESKAFSRLRAHLFMFFQSRRSRIYATHARVIGHPVDCQHVGCRPGVDRVRVGVPAQIIETCNHGVLESLVHHIFPPKIPHSVLHPLKIGDRDPTGVRQDVRNYEDAFLIENFVGGGVTVSYFE